MERVAFLLERTGQRLGCLLNPESVVMRRTAGVARRSAAHGGLAGVNLADEPLLYTGGGRTEITLDLLFDVDVSGSTIATRDVRELTRPLWDLAENSADARSPVPLVRLVWGKSWNISGVVVAVAERLEWFEADGSPRRSWLRMRMLRVADPAERTERPMVPPPAAELPPEAIAVSEADVSYHELQGGSSDDAGAGAQRLDEVAAETYGDPGYWKLIAAFNDVADPFALKAGEQLRLPPLRLLRRQE